MMTSLTNNASLSVAIVNQRSSQTLFIIYIIHQLSNSIFILAAIIINNNI